MTATSPAASARPVYTDIGKALGTDYFLLKADLTAEERDYLERTRRFVHDEVLPQINDFWERAEVPVDLCRRLGELGLIGDGLEGYGCPPMSSTAAGLIAMELNRGDGSIGTFCGVQGGLAMCSIHMHGSEEQKQRWLPAMARCEKLGAFAGRPIVAITFAVSLIRLSLLFMLRPYGVDLGVIDRGLASERSSPTSSGCRHAVSCTDPSPSTGTSGGSTSAQSSRALGQRVWNRHPRGGLVGVGRSPTRTIRSRLSATSGSACGRADSSARV